MGWRVEFKDLAARDGDGSTGNDGDCSEARSDEVTG